MYLISEHCTIFPIFCEISVGILNLGNALSLQNVFAGTLRFGVVTTVWQMDESHIFVANCAPECADEQYNVGAEYTFTNRSHCAAVIPCRNEKKFYRRIRHQPSAGTNVRLDTGYTFQVLPAFYTISLEAGW